jgi:hypothetical protein
MSGPRENNSRVWSIVASRHKGRFSVGEAPARHTGHCPAASRDAPTAGRAGTPGIRVCLRWLRPPGLSRSAVLKLVRVGPRSGGSHRPAVTVAACEAPCAHSWAGAFRVGIRLRGLHGETRWTETVIVTRADRPPWSGDGDGTSRSCESRAENRWCAVADAHPFHLAPSLRRRRPSRSQREWSEVVTARGSHPPPTPQSSLFPQKRLM